MKAYEILTSTDGTNWMPVVTETANAASRTYYKIDKPVSAQHVKLNITTATDSGDNAVHIYEFEIYP